MVFSSSDLAFLSCMINSFCYLLSVATDVKETSYIPVFHSWVCFSSFILAILKVIAE